MEENDGCCSEKALMVLVDCHVDISQLCAEVHQIHAAPCPVSAVLWPAGPGQ